jgi:shikimate kinase
MNVILIGFRCTGKTAVGRELARRLGRPFVDADTCLQERAGKNIAAIFAEGGEPLFRRLEREVLAELTQKDGIVLAAGGGAVLDEGNVRRLRGSGLVVRLTASLETILRRLADDEKTESERPRLTGEADLRREVEQLLAGREPFYQRAAHVTIDTEGLTVSQVAEEVLRQLSAREAPTT